MDLESEGEGKHRILPTWLSITLEMRVCRYIDQYTGWQSKIEKRAQIGKDLTASQQLKYDQWKMGNDPRMIFSQERKKLVSEACQVKKDCIALQLHLAPEPENLLVTSSSGVKYRLALLCSEADDDNANLEASMSKQDEKT